MEPLRKAERIAALLDGNLDERERAALLAELGASDDDLELLLDSAAITRQLEEEDAAAAGARPADDAPAVITADAREAEVIPITAAPSRRAAARWWADRRLLAAAAVAVLAVGSATWLARARDPGSPVDALASTVVPATWSYPWARTRGEGQPLGPRAVSVRFGAFATGLELAARNRDRAAGADVADSVATLLTHGAPLVARRFRDLAAEPGFPEPGNVRRRIAEAERGLEPGFVELGRWAEAARHAAQKHDAAFFRARVSRGYAQGHGPAKLNEPGTAALGRVRDALANGGAPDWRGLQKALDDLLEEAG